MALTASEIRMHERVDHFTACATHMAWVHTRGRMDPDGTDGGKDLMMMERAPGGSPRVVLSNGKGLSAAVWSPSGDRFIIHSGGWLLIGSPGEVPKQWLKLPTGEVSSGLVWAREGVVLFSTRSGTPNRERLYRATPPSGAAGGAVGKKGAGVLLFTAEEGGALVSYDFSPSSALAAIAHQRANAMLAEVLIVPGVEDAESTAAPRVIATDGRVEYCKPHVRFLADGRLLARLNLVIDREESAAPVTSGVCATALSVQEATPPAVTHGLFILSFGDSPGTPGGAAFEAVHLDVDGAEFGSYDVCSSSYGAIGANNAFVLDSSRQVVAVTARSYTTSTCDRLMMASLCNPSATMAASAVEQLASPKGCHVPVFIGQGGDLIYHFRSPTEWGDLWVCDSGVCVGTGSAKAKPVAQRLTHTMPLSVQNKLFEPVEVFIDTDRKKRLDGQGQAGADKQHALVFYPPASTSSDGAELQPLLWIHGGPMCVVSFDYSPFLCWLASLGYVVCVPNFSGSTGFGVEHMDSVLGKGCGIADLADCLAAAQYMRGMTDARVDLRRGVGVAGHSWGGYLSLMCMTQLQESMSSVQAGPSCSDGFGCGIALAGIADWFVQQRHTEVRYYDYALMGGWVYEPHIAARAKAASPVTRASHLRAPLLVLHGDKDCDVPYRQITTFVDAAKRSTHAGSSVEFVSYAGEGHGLSGTKAQKDVLDQLERFLRVHLKPWDFTSNPHGDVAAY